MTIMDFLEARLAEDEAAATAEVDLVAATYGKVPGEFKIHYEWARHTAHVENGARGASFAPGAPDPARVLREVAAKRSLVELYGALSAQWAPNVDYGFAYTALRTLAAIYSSHPDYQQEWAL